MNRLEKRFADLRGRGDKAFVAYIMAGEPSWTSTLSIIRELDRAGVTAVELGVPFSDPIADGPVIQAAGNRSLASGVTLKSIFDNVERLRSDCDIPLLLMGYWNVFRNAGSHEVVDRAVNVGVDGFIIPDLPLEAGVDFYDEVRRRGLATVLLATELTPRDRLQQIAKAVSGFLYYVPKLGITGLDLEVTTAIRERIGEIKGLTDQPVLVGIGVKSAQDVARLVQASDGVIVGTRIVDFIDQHRDDQELPRRTAAMVAELLPGKVAAEQRKREKTS
jgi:tryptophan synthase alpha chain